MATPSTFGSHEKASALEVELGDWPPQPLAPGPELVLVEGVVQAHHGHAVAHLLEQARGRGARRSGSASRRVASSGCSASSSRSSRTSRSYSASGISGAVERVVALVVVVDQLAQLATARSARRRCARARRPRVRRRCPRRRPRRARRRRRGPPSARAPPGAAARRTHDQASSVELDRARHRPAVRTDLCDGARHRGQRRSTQVSEASARRPRTRSSLGALPDGHPARRARRRP